MNKKLYIGIIACLLTVSVQAKDTLRIMTYNMAIGLMGEMEQIGSYIHEQHPDIVALQEVDMYTLRPERTNDNSENQPVELGFYADMLPLYGKVLPHPNGGYYGLGFLSKHPVNSCTLVQLPQVEKEEPRAMLIATWTINGKNLTIASTHLSLNKRNREAQMRHIRSYMQRFQGIKFICGDMNSNYEEGLVAKIFHNWRDALPTGQNTYSSWNPIHKYDWMLYKKNSPIEVINAQVDTLCNLSDHLPCYIDIEF